MCLVPKQHAGLGTTRRPDPVQSHQHLWPSVHSKDTPQAGTGLDLPSAPCHPYKHPSSGPAALGCAGTSLAQWVLPEATAHGLVRCAALPGGRVSRKELMMLVMNRVGLGTPTRMLGRPLDAGNPSVLSLKRA